MKFDKSVGDRILATWNQGRYGRFELPGGDMLTLDPSDEFEIKIDDTAYYGKDIIEIANGLRFVLDDGATRTYLYSECGE